MTQRNGPQLRSSGDYAVHLQAGSGSGHSQRLVVGDRLAGQQFSRTTGDAPEALGIALQDRDPSPPFQGLEQLAQVEALPGVCEGLLVIGVERGAVLVGEQRGPDMPGDAPGRSG